MARRLRRNNAFNFSLYLSLRADEPYLSVCVCVLGASHRPHRESPCTHTHTQSYNDSRAVVAGLCHPDSLPFPFSTLRWSTLHNMTSMLHRRILHTHIHGRWCARVIMTHRAERVFFSSLCVIPSRAIQSHIYTRETRARRSRARPFRNAAQLHGVRSIIHVYSAYNMRTTRLRANMYRCWVSEFAVYDCTYITALEGRSHVCVCVRTVGSHICNYVIREEENYE